MAASRKPNELYITRVFDAPVKLVWDAWTDPKQVGQWWGPRGFTLTTRNRETRPGGKWIYTMHGPDGTDYPNVTTYHEVEKYSRLVYDHGATETTPPLFRVTVDFMEIDGKTKMDMTMALATPEAAQETRKFIKKAGGDATWDRLAEYLHEQGGKDKFVINRTFEAPIDLVFDMWTDTRHIAQWLPPAGMTTKFFKGDIKKGGRGFWCMEGTNGVMYGKSEYHEVTRPNRIVYTQSFCDENQQTIRHPMAPTWPETMLTTVVLDAEDSNRTRVTVTWEVFGEATPTERETFHNAKPGMTQGWTGSFDKLESYLQRPRPPR
jgi:uncharacterized protein YndB with AHSA1/START domain